MLEEIISKIAQKLAGRSLFMVFDRDGTLVPYHPDPKQAIMPEGVKDLLLQLNAVKNNRIGILSARDLKQLEFDFEEKDLILAGNYGMEILLPNKTSFSHPLAEEARPALLKVKAKLEKKLPAPTRIILEDHRLVLCLHWHMTPTNFRNQVHSTIDEIKTETPELRFKTLPTSYEVWPPIEWNKANGLEQINNFMCIDKTKHLILYAGDTEADEPAFQWVNEREGISLSIGKKHETAALFNLDSASQMPDFLSQLLKLFI